MKYKKYFLAVLYMLIIWYVLSFICNIPIIPSPLAVIKNLISIFLSKIAVHALYSLWRVLAGILLSLLAGVPIGLLMGYYKKLDKAISPFIYFLYPIPKIALLPIVMLLLGLGEWSKIFMISLIVIFQIIIASRDAVKDIPKETYYSLYSLGAAVPLIFRHVVIPASLPSLLTSIRVGLGTAISVLFFTETFGTQYGMGYYIMDSWTRVNYIDMYSGIIVLSIMGFMLFTAVDAAEKKYCSWK